MNLRLTRRHWNQLARRDPLWAVLTAPDKAGNRWQADDFFADGRRTVDAELAGVRAHYPALRRGSALDFGCGVGRLSQGLAGHFDRVTGVDLSEEMLALARTYNRHGERVAYVHNARRDLRVLGDARFDFVYSILTLQHMDPADARAYIREFVRVTAPGGAILFQIPSEGLRDPPDSTLLTLWPPTLFKRLKRRWSRQRNRWLAENPLMEMHGLPRAEVEAVLAEAGARLIKAYPYGAAGNVLESWGYLACKPADGRAG
ncbi:MAG TPA: class I SAM-dependent methyltransferase [Opitutaceae bacterium]|nr:class I SAM-dependent methyltransferase [Opitutaceae bacterium]